MKRHQRESPLVRDEVADVAHPAGLTDRRTRIKDLLDELQRRVDEGLEDHIAQWPSVGDRLVDDGPSLDFDRAVDDALAELSSDEPEPGTPSAVSWMDAVRIWSARSRERRALRELAELDDHFLKDIGVSRGQVLREAAKPFWQR